MAPGHYWVKAVYSREIREEKDKKWVTLGQISVPDEATDEVIQIKPNKNR